MTIVSKTAGVAGILSAVSDIHKTAVIYSRNDGAKKSCNSYLSTALGSQKANRISSKDAQRKNWLLRKDFFSGASGAFGRVTGYLHGAGEAIVRNLPTIGLSVSSLLVKNKKIANFSALGLAGVQVYDFIKNATGLGQKTDYLKLK